MNSIAWAAGCWAAGTWVDGSWVQAGAAASWRGGLRSPRVHRLRRAVCLAIAILLLP